MVGVTNDDTLTPSLSVLTLGECETETLRRMAKALKHLRLAQLETDNGLAHDDLEMAADLVRKAMRRVGA